MMSFAPFHQILFEELTLEKNHYTKMEFDERLALMNELSVPKLSGNYTKTEAGDNFVSITFDTLDITSDTTINLQASNSFTVNSQYGIYLNYDYGVWVNIPEKIHDQRTESYNVTENVLSGYYTKEEDKFALKNDLSACIKTTEPQTITSTYYQQAILNLCSSYFGVGDNGPVLKSRIPDYKFEIKYGAGTQYLESNGIICLMFDVDDGSN